MKQKHLLVGVVSLVIVITGIAWFFLHTEKVPVITSDDGTASLIIPKDTLPDGVKMKDISITTIPRGEDGPLATYSLEPHGLELEEPVTLTLYVDAEAEGLFDPEKGSFRIPEIYHTAEDGSLRPIEDTKVWFDMETKVISVDVTLKTFSYVQETEGHLEASLLLDPWLSEGDSYPVNQTFTAHANVTYIDQLLRHSVRVKNTYQDKVVDDRPIGKMNVFGGSYMASTERIIPRAYLDRPNEEILNLGETYTMETADFKCREPTRDDYIMYSVAFDYKTRRTEPGKKDTVVSNSPVVVVKAPVRCSGKPEEAIGTVGEPGEPTPEPCMDSYRTYAVNFELRIDPCKEEYLVGEPFTAHGNIDYRDGRFDEVHERRSMRYESPVSFLKLMRGQFRTISLLRPQKVAGVPEETDIYVDESYNISQPFTCIEPGKTELSYGSAFSYTLERRTQYFSADGKPRKMTISHWEAGSPWNTEPSQVNVTVICKAKPKKDVGSIGEDPEPKEGDPCTNIMNMGPVRATLKLDPCKKYKVGDSFTATSTLNYGDDPYHETVTEKYIEHFVPYDDLIASGEFGAPDFIEPGKVEGMPDTAKIAPGNTMRFDQIFTCRRPSEGPSPFIYSAGGNYVAERFRTPVDENGEKNEAGAKRDLKASEAKLLPMVLIECLDTALDDDQVVIGEDKDKEVIGEPEPEPQESFPWPEEGEDQGTVGGDEPQLPPPSPPPTATIIPGNGSEHVPVGENILINFSQPMHAASVLTALRIDFKYSLEWKSPSQLIIKPENLKLDKNYTVIVSTLAHDMHGISLQQTARSSFTTGEPEEERVAEEEEEIDDYVPTPPPPPPSEEEAQPTPEPPTAPSGSCTDVCGADRVYVTSNESSCYDTSGSFAQIPNKQPCYNYNVARGWQTDSNCCCQDIIMSLSDTCELDRFSGWDANGWAVMDSGHTVYPY